MLEILIDTDVILDVLLKREPFFESSLNAFVQLHAETVSGFIAATTATNLFYLIRKKMGRENTFFIIRELLETPSLDVQAVDKRTILDALQTGMSDFENAVQAAVAALAKLDYIVTKNLKDYRDSPVPAVSPR